MFSRRKLVSILLAISVIALWLTPNAASQILASTTTIPLNTTTISSTTTSVTMSTLTSTISSTATTASTFGVYSGTFSIPSPYGTSYDCYYHSLHSDLLAGTAIGFRIVSSTPIDFYFLTDSDYNNWANSASSTCTSVPGAIFVQTNIQSYTSTTSNGIFTVNQERTFYFLFINSSPDTASVTFDAIGGSATSSTTATTLQVTTTSSFVSTTSTSSTFFTTSTGGLLAGRCLIATATYGSELSPEVQILRDFRDNQILKTAAGSAFMVVFNAWYYSFSPSVAEQLSANAVERTMMKGVLYPLIGILKFSSLIFSATSSFPELAALLSGLTASSLIGALYVGLPLSLLRVKIRRLRGSNVQGWMEKSLIMIFAVGSLVLVVGELFASSMLLMLASVVVVLSALFFSAVFTSGRIVAHHAP